MNQRRRTRVHAQKLTTVDWPNGRCDGEIVNVSMKGCLLGNLSGDSAALGATVSVTIHLEAGAPELDLHVAGRVVRSDDTGLAVDFTEIALESFGHLFRLVQYNATDPEDIEEELGTSAFQPPQES